MSEPEGDVQADAERRADDHADDAETRVAADGRDAASVDGQADASAPADAATEESARAAATDEARPTEDGAPSTSAAEPTGGETGPVDDDASRTDAARDEGGAGLRDAVVSLEPAFDTDYWTGIGALALAAVGLALPFKEEGLFLVALVGVGYAAYARATQVPDVAVAVDRELSDATPDPEDEVTVTVTVTNVGEAPLPDLRLVDGVPEGLAVTDGSARLGTALRPGKRATFSYTVTAVRGTHEWEPMTAIVRDVSGSRERVAEAEAGTTLSCLPSLEATADLPLRGLTTPYTGQVATDVGGAGLEFHSTRRYRHGDPLSRIDWNRYARTGSLSTLEFREERAATVVLLVDTRETAYVSSGEEQPNAVERSVDAAAQAFSTLLSTGDRVGIASYGPQECWLAPSTGEAHRARARELLGSHPAFSVAPTGGTFYPSLVLQRLRKRLPADAQLVFFTPLVDDYIVTVARRLDAYGHKVSVVSPDPTTDESSAHRLTRVERDQRLRRLRGARIRAVDWGDRPLAVELAEASRRWSR